jgi:hypothetical protein
MTRWVAGQEETEFFSREQVLVSTAAAAETSSEKK